MYLDSFLMCLLICLGAMIAYAVDEQVQFTPRLARWLVRILD